MVSVLKKDKYRRLVSPGIDKHLPVYNWFNFKHSFSSILVADLISELNIKAGSWVLDPYCGGGTTLLTCKKHNIHSLGIDILPFSVFLTNVKTRDYDEQVLVKEFKYLVNKIKVCKNPSVALPEDISLLDKAFSQRTKNDLIKIKFSLNTINDPHVRDFFNLAFLSILESVSNTSKDGGFLRILNQPKSSKKVERLFYDRCGEMIGDVIKQNALFNNTKTKTSAQIGDARKIKSRRKFDAIITSPPYPNRHDYTRVYTLEMVFDHVSSNSELKNIRYDTLRSHVEARKKFNVEGYEKPKNLDNLIRNIRKSGLNNSKVPEMLEGYFEDMYICLAEMKKRLKKGGKIALVVSNVRFSGVNILVDKILYELGRQVGLNPITIWSARDRGNSSQQMKKYSKNSSRESIIIWENNN